MNEAIADEFLSWRIAGAVILKVSREYRGPFPIGMKKAVRGMRLNGKLPTKTVSELDLALLETARGRGHRGSVKNLKDRSA